MSQKGYRVREVDVVLSISDGKLSVESRSGAKGGVVELSPADDRANLTLQGAGSDEATATLSGPELSHFRTNVDAVLSSLSMDQGSQEDDKRILSTEYQSLVPHDDGFAVTVDEQALRRLGLVDEGGALTGGGRQVRTSVLNSGTAIVNLLSEDETGTEFRF